MDSHFNYVFLHPSNFQNNDLTHLTFPRIREWLILRYQESLIYSLVSCSYNYSHFSNQIIFIVFALIEWLIGWLIDSLIDSSLSSTFPPTMEIVLFVRLYIVMFSLSMWKMCGLGFTVSRVTRLGYEVTTTQS